MATLDIEQIKEINRHWEPIYPYLARQVREIYQRSDGRVLDIGPFCSVVYSLLQENVGDSHVIASFPHAMAEFFMREARVKGLADRIDVVASAPSLEGIDDASVDLAVFRGAFFFPSLFEADVAAISRKLKAGGTAFVGGGFGKYTPENVIRSIGKRSRELNLNIGKVEISEETLRQKVTRTHIKARAEIITEGGLWLVMRT